MVRTYCWWHHILKSLNMQKLSCCSATSFMPYWSVFTVLEGTRLRMLQSHSDWTLWNMIATCLENIPQENILIHWDTNLMGVTNYFFFLIKVKVHISWDGTHTDTVDEAKKLRRDRSWTLGETPLVILLNEHSNKTTLNDILLYPHILISALLSPYQRSCFLQMVISIETHNWTTYRVKDMVLSSKRNVCITPLLSKA